MTAFTIIKKREPVIGGSRTEQYVIHATKKSHTVVPLRSVSLAMSFFNIPVMLYLYLFCMFVFDLNRDG